MSQLTCPLCGENLKEEGVHFFKHFKYKKYPCGENSCDLEFYAEADRNAHCSKHGHKRSFQKSVNPYIDNLIAMISSDARELATKDMETVLENRWGGDPDIRIVAPPKPSPDPSTSGVKKRSLIVEKTPAVTAKKTKKSVNSTHSEISSSHSADETPRRPAKDLPSSSSTSRLVPIEVDSTTTDASAQPISSAERQKRGRKKRVTTEAVPLANQSYAEMSALDKLVGWYDPNVPERRDAAKVDCAVCQQQIVYDYILRKSHVTSVHMAADIAPEDYDDLLRTAMDKSYPELPNSNLACQLCMTCADIPKNRRREHIEKNHTTSLPPLQCPFAECQKGYRRQCDLSSHMKDTHKVEMSKLKNPQFQTTRRHRNVMINALIDKCFPWATLEVYEKPDKKKIQKIQESASEPIQRIRTTSEQVFQPIGDFSLDNDVRVFERSVNKTRRAPQYNTLDSSSESSDSEGEDNPVEDGARDGSPHDYAQDIIYIGQKFNSEVAEKLKQRNIKTEIVVPPNDDDEKPVEPIPEAPLEVPMDIDMAETTKEEVIEEDVKDESNTAAVVTNTARLMIEPPVENERVEKYGDRSQRPRDDRSRVDYFHHSSSSNRSYYGQSSSSSASNIPPDSWRRGNYYPSSSRNYRSDRRHSPNRNYPSRYHNSGSQHRSSYNRDNRRF